MFCCIRDIGFEFWVFSAEEIVSLRLLVFEKIPGDLQVCTP
jgi:hypothetical protein